MTKILRLLVAVCTVLIPAVAFAHGNEGAFASRSAGPSTDVSLTAEEAKSIGLTLAEVDGAEIAEVLEVPAELNVPPERGAEVTARTDGRVAAIFVHLGQRVRAGQRLFALESPQVAMILAAWRSAAAQVPVARAELDRQETLFKSGIAAGKDVAMARAALAEADAKRNGAAGQLSALGLGPQEIQKLAGAGTGTRLEARAPIEGVVSHVAVGLGQPVTAATRLATVIDPRRLYAEARLFEKDVARVKMGQKVRVHVEGGPPAGAAGAIRFLGVALDPVQRTLPIIAEVQNASGTLRAGMTARLSIILATHQADTAVPLAAVLHEGGETFVIVKNGDRYAKQAVAVGTSDDDRVEVTDGLVPGDRVVVNGNREIYTKLLYQ